MAVIEGTRLLTGDDVDIHAMIRSQKAEQQTPRVQSSLFKIGSFGRAN